MTTTALLWFAQSVLFPLLLAALVVTFFYGLVNYFVLGASDDDRREAGRNQLLTADAGFILIVLVVFLFQGIVSLELPHPFAAPFGTGTTPGTAPVPTTPEVE